MSEDTKVKLNKDGIEAGKMLSPQEYQAALKAKKAKAKK